MMIMIDDIENDDAIMMIMISTTGVIGNIPLVVALFESSLLLVIFCFPDDFLADFRTGSKSSSSSISEHSD